MSAPPIFFTFADFLKKMLVFRTEKAFLLSSSMEKVIYQDLGRISYKKAWDYQQERLRELIDRKLSNRNLQPYDPDFSAYRHYLLFCDHPHVYTLGKSGSPDHLLLNEQQLEEHGIEFFKINRGGDITYHGPGQIVGYPIFDLDRFFTDVHKYVRFLEEAVIRTLAEYGLTATRHAGYTGVWLAGDADRPERKICAIGVHLSRWVTLHGFAFNVNSDLSYFKNIIPCGINEEDKDVTSLAAELGRKIDINETKRILKKHFQELFEFVYAEEKEEHRLK